MTIRYARWAAVSSKAQAKEDKASLDVQLKETQRTSESKGWTETAGPFVVPGQSRTKWVNLRDAEDELPALRQMLDSAKAGEYDVLVMYDFDRLRDLLDPVSRVLADYGVQLYDIHLGIEPQPPATFSPYDDAAQIGQLFSNLKSKSAINNLQRHFRDKMPGRIFRGLHAGLGRPPYGYAKPPGQKFDKNAILVPTPAEARTVIQMKDWFLDGMSSTQIAV
jgi:DNA invertase Pin-like site-specific DNA recombinase